MNRETRLFAAIWVPGFPLRAVERLERSLEGRPVVLMEEAGRKAVVTWISASARTVGVHPGMTAAQAVARCPDLIVRGRSPEAEKSAREALLAIAFTLSPRVEETAEGLCTVDLQGTLRDRLVPRGERLVRELGKLGLDGRIGFAGNPLLAFYAAHCADPVLEVCDERAFLRDLPVAIADPSSRIAEILQQWGIGTLGALTALPREEVAKRLGEEGIALWDRADGRSERVLRLTKLPETFEEAMELEYEMETLEPLLFILRRFIDQLTVRLGAVYQAAEEVKLELTLTDGSSYARAFRLPEPTREPELLFRMLHTHLENVRTEFPIVRIYLWVKPCKPTAKQQDLFEAAVKDAYAFADTLARLVALTGSGNVGSPRLEATHRPDAFRLVPLVPIQPGAETSDRMEREPTPMRRYRPPRPAHVFCENGRPVHLTSEDVRGQVRKVQGPWRLSGNWWEPTRWSRDEWDIELPNGGLYRLVRENKQWYLEGEYG